MAFASPNAIEPWLMRAWQQLRHSEHEGWYFCLCLLKACTGDRPWITSSVMQYSPGMSMQMQLRHEREKLVSFRDIEKLKGRAVDDELTVDRLREWIHQEGVLWTQKSEGVGYRHLVLFDLVEDLNQVFYFDSVLKTIAHTDAEQLIQQMIFNNYFVIRYLPLGERIRNLRGQAQFENIFPN